MKTSLGIATIAVVFSAILSLAPTVATADYMPAPGTKRTFANQL